MSDQPFKDEDVKWRWRPTDVERKSLGLFAHEYVVAKTGTHNQLYFVDPEGFWYHEETLTAWTVELLRQRQELEDALRLIQQSTSGPSCGECVIPAYVYAVLDKQEEEARP
jgi:hypothetical protein